MSFQKDPLKNLKQNISTEIKTIKEINFLFSHLSESNAEEKIMINSQLKSLQSSLRKTKKKIINSLNKLSLPKSLSSEIKQVPLESLKFQAKKITNFPRQKIEKQEEKPPIVFPPKSNPTKLPLSYNNSPLLKAQHTPRNQPISQPSPKKKLLDKLSMITDFEKNTLKRLMRKEKKAEKKKIKTPSKYVNMSNKFFGKFSKSIVNKKTFRILKRDLIKANMQFVPDSYLSLILFTTLVSVIGAFFIFIFFLLFNIGPKLPIITMVTENFGIRFLKTFWILFIIPIITFIFMYFYPSLEKKAAESKINQELPFATIHMSAISGSLVEPSKIFSIIISTKEYPYLEKEFIKLINEINVYGYDLINDLRNRAFNSPSKKLAELFNGLATTITSGGDLTEFFDKRSQTLLFEHRIEKEKRTKASETFMDIYISVVIAAPMILMLLLIMMKIGGLGLALSISAITLIMVLGVSIINLIFITFLHLKQPGE